MQAINTYILATLAYFDMFSYPLTEGEIHLFLSAKFDRQDVNEAIRKMATEKQIFRYGRFYSLTNGPEKTEKREAGNLKAFDLLKTAEKVSRILIRFPYVRGVAISGSLSKNYADDKSDIDLFIITSANCLWIARSFMHLLKKLSFLVNKQHLFCMNYYVDETSLEIAEKNLYTATEIVTLIPMQGDIAFEKFYAGNAWTRKYLPNNIMRISSADEEPKPVIKRFIEFVFNNALGTALDKKLMQLTERKWQKKTELGLLNMRGVVMSMKAARHCAKPNPGNFQDKLIARYESKVMALLKEQDAEQMATSSLTK